MRIILEPVGGLGNQLFAYALAKELQSRLHATISFRLCNYIQNDKFKFELNSFKDGSQFELTQNIPYGFVYDSSIFHFFMNNFPIFRRFNFPKIFYEKDMKFSDTVFKHTSNFVARGFFQSWKYFEHSELEIKNNIRNISNESTWFKELKNELSARKNFTAIHIRGGDYKATPSIGVLKERYYEQAVALLSNMNSLSPNPVIFTDDETYLNKISIISHLKPRVISAPLNSRPIESLLLMSMANNIIIANSTFSWWSAWLSNANAVIAPRPWLLNSHHNDRDLIPPTWLTLGR